MACGDPKALPSVTILDPDHFIPAFFCCSMYWNSLSHALESALPNQEMLFLKGMQVNIQTHMLRYLQFLKTLMT